MRILLLLPVVLASSFCNPEGDAPFCENLRCLDELEIAVDQPLLGDDWKIGVALDGDYTECEFQLPLVYGEQDCGAFILEERAERQIGLRIIGRPDTVEIVLIRDVIHTEVVATLHPEYEELGGDEECVPSCSRATARVPGCDWETRDHCPHFCGSDALVQDSCVDGEWACIDGVPSEEC